MLTTPPVLLWFRRDLRLADNPALTAALRHGSPVIPVFILDEKSEGSRPLGGAARWWLGRSLASLDRSLTKLGAKLVLRCGPSLPILHDLAVESGAKVIFFNRRFDPPGVALDQAITEKLAKEDVMIEDHEANYLHEPWQLKTGLGDSFKVFTPFWRRLTSQYSPSTLHPGPRHWPSVSSTPKSDSLKDFSYERHWVKDFNDLWQPGEAGARRQLKEFLDNAVEDYSHSRDRPDTAGTSRLSPHLAWGEISVHRAWQEANPERWSGAAAFRRELAWRDFNMHVYYHFAELPSVPWQHNFCNFPFKKDDVGLHAWQHGKTGYPLVDAGMRQLWQTGWMHNRVRMVVASFLIKHQLIDWRRGEEWFWDTLIDADPAQNAGNWQWVAGCGFDAAPFFRIFNPILQGEKFDPQGDYVRRWVPELAKLRGKEIHAPWKLSKVQLDEAGIRLGKNYPEPIVSHDQARKRALTAYRQISGKGNEDNPVDLFSR